MIRRLTSLARTMASGIKDSRVRHAFIIVFSAVGFFSVCSLAFVSGGLLPSQYAWTASIIIGLNALAVFVSELRWQSVRAVMSTFVLLTVGGFLVELAGMTTGFPFGRYSYTDVLGFRVFGVPLAIALAWYVTIICTIRIAFWIHGKVTLMRLAFSAALMTLALDIALEPMASFINGYWIWEGGSVPPQNYLSWFLLGLAGALVTLFRERKYPDAQREGLALSSAFVFATQFILFAVTNAVNGYLLATLAALVFGSIPFFSRIKHRWFFREEGLIER